MGIFLRPFSKSRCLAASKVTYTAIERNQESSSRLPKVPLARELCVPWRVLMARKLNPGSKYPNVRYL